MPSNFTSNDSLNWNVYTVETDYIYSTSTGMYSDTSRWSDWDDVIYETSTAVLSSTMLGSNMTASTVGATKTIATYSCTMKNKGNSTFIGNQAGYGGVWAVTSSSKSANSNTGTAMGSVDNSS